MLSESSQSLQTGASAGSVIPQRRRACQRNACCLWCILAAELMSWRGEQESNSIQTQAMRNPPVAARSRTSSSEDLILLTAVALFLAATRGVVSCKPTLMTPQLPRRYLMAECGALQAALVEHANTWAAKFTDLLHRVAHKQLAALRERLANARQALQEVRGQGSLRNILGHDALPRHGILWLECVTWRCCNTVSRSSSRRCRRCGVEGPGSDSRCTANYDGSLVSADMLLLRHFLEASQCRITLRPFRRCINGIVSAACDNPYLGSA